MSKETSTILKGIAILMMLFYHLFNRTEINELCSPLIMFGETSLVHYLSQACYPVPFFLILSGYGLTYLYKHNRLGILSESRRLLKLYIHYWLVLLIFMPVAFFLYPTMYQYDILHIIGNITAVRCNYNGEVWFLFPYALICLTAYPIINYLCQLHGKVKIIFTIFVYAILFMTAKYLSFCPSDNLFINIIQQQFFYYVILLFYFALGILLYGLLEKKVFFSFHNQKIYIMLIVCLVIIKSLFKITIADGLYALLFIILFLNISFPLWINKILSELGRRSMVMWMTHTFFAVYLFPQFFYGMKYPVLIFVSLVITTYITAIPIMMIGKKISKMLSL